MPDPDEKMVLRTVYLPRDLDDKLRLVAFRSRATKGDLVRQALTTLLSDHEKLTLPKVANEKKTAPKRGSRARPKVLESR